VCGFSHEGAFLEIKKSLENALKIQKEPEKSHDFVIINESLHNKEM